MWKTQWNLISEISIALEQLGDSLEERRGSASSSNMLWGGGPACGVKSIHSKVEYWNLIDLISIIPNPINRIERRIFVAHYQAITYSQTLCGANSFHITSQRGSRPSERPSESHPSESGRLSERNLGQAVRFSLERENLAQAREPVSRKLKYRGLLVRARVPSYKRKERVSQTLIFIFFSPLSLPTATPHRFRLIPPLNLKNTSKPLPLASEWNIGDIWR
ncbi:hypothetical protein Lal_00043061 [Lupinus albus]|nr:hypothetical protein Lal_00043061 [Lupinus albus]